MRLIFIGPPGVGKGTQATLIKDHFDILHLSTGDILREEILQQSTIGIKAKSFMDRGHLVPDNILLEMMETTDIQFSAILLNSAKVSPKASQA